MMLFSGKTGSNSLTWHYRSGDPEDWNNMLYDIYKAANNTERASYATMCVTEWCCCKGRYEAEKDLCE